MLPSVSASGSVEHLSPWKAFGEDVLSVLEEELLDVDEELY